MAGRWFVVAIVFVAVALAGCAKTHGGEIDGSLLTFPNGSSRPTAGTVMVSSRGREVARVHTDRRGSFSIHLALGTYTLHGTTASGVKCISDTVKIRNSAGESLTLKCI